jgi:hypothetical protein
MTKYRSAQGKTIDMSVLAARNERTRAVGNMNVNARGDTIDATGKIIVPVTRKVNENYQRAVANKSAIVTDGNSPNNQPTSPEVDEILNVLSEEELEFADTSDEDEEIAAIKAAEVEQFVIKPASEAPDFVVPEATTTKKK